MKLSRRVSWSTVVPVALLVFGALAMFATPAQAAYQNCNQICSYSPPSTNCTCWYPGGYYHPGCGQWQLNGGCFPGLNPVDAPQDEATMSFDSQLLLATPVAAPSPAEEQTSAPAPAADCQIPEPASQPAAQLLAPSSD